MSNTYRWVHPNSYEADTDHWYRFEIKSIKHLTRDRGDGSYKSDFRWSKYDGRGALYRREQELNKEFKDEVLRQM